jgi:hypothetical protein
MKERIPLNAYDSLPEEFVKYFRINGMHFNRKMYEFAVSLMYTEDKDGSKKAVKPVTREEFDAVMSKYGIEIPKDSLYDGLYVWSMTCADSPKSIPDEHTRAVHVQEYLSDPDQRPGFVFNRFYNDTVWNGIPIDWEYVNS